MKLAALAALVLDDEGARGALDGYSKPCVGSGLCCLKARCFLGVQVHGPGAECPSLVWKEGRYWCGEILKAEGETLEHLRQQLYVGEGCCMPLFNSLREERFRSMTEAQREEYRRQREQLRSKLRQEERLVTISLSRSSVISSGK
jgi:hypothetical protein